MNRPACLLLAAGNSRRFGRNKLRESIQGKTLLERALDAVPLSGAAPVIVVTQYDEAEALARARGFVCVRNNQPELGISHSIALGLAALSGHDVPGALFMTADQPFLRRESTEALCRQWRATPTRILAAAHDGQRGNPVLFPADLFPELAALTGDQGGRVVAEWHPERLSLWELPKRELADLDTPEDLLYLTKKTGSDGQRNAVR